MPTVFRAEGFRFFFYSNEGDPREPLHIHVMNAGAEARVWLSPEVAMADSSGFDARALRRIVAIAADHAAAIERAWHEYFG